MKAILCTFLMMPLKLQTLHLKLPVQFVGYYLHFLATVFFRQDFIYTMLASDLLLMLRLVLNSRPSCLHPKMLRLQGCSSIPGSTAALLMSYLRSHYLTQVMKPYACVSSMSTCSYMVVCNQFCVKSYMRQWLEFMVLHVKGLIFLI